MFSLVKNSFRVNNSNFVENFASKFGGAISCDQGLIVIINHSHFIKNSAYYHGGAIFGQYEAIEMACNSFQENFAGMSGGAIGIENSHVFRGFTLTFCNFQKNSAKITGGALHIII